MRRCFGGGLQLIQIVLWRRRELWLNLVDMISPNRPKMQEKLSSGCTSDILQPSKLRTVLQWVSDVFYIPWYLYWKEIFRTELLQRKKLRACWPHGNEIPVWLNLHVSPSYNQLFSGDPVWTLWSSRYGTGRTFHGNKNDYRFLHTLEDMGPAPEPNPVLYSSRLPENFKKYANISVTTSSVQYEIMMLCVQYGAMTTSAYCLLRDR